jgi:hypothetical protein
LGTWSNYEKETKLSSKFGTKTISEKANEGGGKEISFQSPSYFPGKFQHFYDYTENEGPLRIRYLNVWFPFMYSQK